MTDIGRRTLIASSAAMCLAKPVLAMPDGDVSFVIPYAPGGGFDAYVRAAIPIMQGHMAPGTRILPVNLEGAGGATAAGHLFHAPPDGHMISVLNMPGALILQMVDGTAGYDLARFSWIGNLGSDPYALCVPMTSQLQTMADVMTLSHRRVVRFPSTGPASMANASTLIATKLLGIGCQIVSGYRGSADCIIGTIRGDGDAAISSLTSMLGLAQQGLVRILATFEASTSLAGIPDATALGRPELAQLVQYRPVAGPPGMPAEMVARLASALDATLTDPRMIAWASAHGANLQPATPEATRRMLSTQTDFINKWRDVLSTPS